MGLRKGRGGRRSGPGRWLATLVAVATLLVGADVAAAGTQTFPDDDDRPGPLDISSVTQGHAGSGKVKHTITTFSNWKKGILGPRTPNFFSLEFSLDGDPAPERVVIVFSAAGNMQAPVFTQRGRLLGMAQASRPNAHTVAVVIRKALLSNPAGYDWQVLSFFQGANVCTHRCVDRAPDGAGKILHDLRPPSISFPQPPAPGSTMYNLDFSVGDSGGSGLATWELQQRDAGVVLGEVRPLRGVHRDSGDDLAV